MRERLVSLRLIADNLMVHPLLRDIPFERIVSYCADFMRLVGCPQMFYRKEETVEIHNYRGLLPCDFVRGEQVRYKKKNSERYIYLRAAFDSFDPKDGDDYKYRIQGDIIYTSFEDGEIEISYWAIPVDDDEYPMIPYNPSFTRALELYIKKQWFTILFDLGKVTQQAYNQLLQEYSWAVGDCQDEFNRMTLDEAETVFTAWNSLIIRNKQHSTGFANEGRRRR